MFCTEYQTQLVGIQRTSKRSPSSGIYPFGGDRYAGGYYRW